MNPKEMFGLIEAYSEVYAPQEVEEATAMAKRGLDEPAIRQKIAANTKGGEAADRATALADKKTYGQSGVNPAARQKLAATQRGDFRNTTSSNPGLKGYAHKATNAADKAKQDARGVQRGSATLTPNEKKNLNMGDETFDIFDYILEFLCVEGFAETLEEAEWLMANVIDEEAIEIILGEEVLDEISQKTATKAYAQSYSGEFEGHDDASDVKRTDNLRKHIKRKFGDKAAEDADRHADSTTFGRKDPRTGKRQEKPQSRTQRPNQFRTRSDGKMHGTDQNKLKAKLKRRIGEEYMDEAQVANRDPEKYEADAKKTETRQQKLERKVGDARKTNPSLDKMMKAYGF